MQPFVHLHVHTQYSILDGQAAIPALVDKAIANGMRAIAITDHGNMFGVKEFLDYVNKKNTGKEENQKFKPIVGCEAYVAPNGRLSRNGKEDMGGRHLILLAKNKIGYHNLIKLISISWVEGFYMRPRIDKELLAQYHEGLIVCSACLGGEIPRLIAADRIADAETSMRWFKDLFGEDYYIEVQRHQTTNPTADQSTYLKQKKVNEVIIPMADRLGIKVICSNDVHFVDEEHADAHDHLICLNTGKDLDDPNRMRYTKQEWLKTQEEMNRVFDDLPDALANTIEIADKIEYYDINSKPIMPDFPLPDGFTDADEYLRHLTYKGAEKRYPNITPDVTERIDFELGTIKHMGFPGYFLIVQDFITAARNMGVAVGPGRGSAAGSVVAYCLKITDIDPLKYDLLFERFLNPDRISMPDIDIDFDDDGRGEVLRWVTEKYGADRVAHIVTFGTMATKSAINDVARVEKLPLSESKRLTKLIPDKIPDKKKVTLRDAIAFVPALQAACQSPNPIMRNTMKYAQMLEGNVRNTGVHACGVIIAKDDLKNYVPIATADDKETGEKMLVTQYEGSRIEDVGMLKMDFLGLKTLSILKEAIENIRQTTGETLDISQISLTDEATYKLYSEGRTTGTFQFESAGMQKYLKELKPTKFEDLIAMNALYRPGPMDNIPSFIARKNGSEEIKYDIPIMEKYLNDTYGITVYQEQVMLLSRLIAGFTRGESDTLRKAMGKKLIDKMNTLKAKFLSGAKANGHSEKVCEKIWADWEKFASYAFNKSHATCYSWIAYQTAYLKANFPSEYMAAVLSRNLSNIADISKFMDECKAMGISVLGPDVNESLFKFSVNKKGDIRFGMGAVKGVGEGAVTAIIEERKKGNFTSLFDFVERINLSACNKKNMEALVMAGGFDNFTEIYREQFFADTGKNETYLEALIRYGSKYQMDKNSAVNSLFGDETTIDIAKPVPPQAPRWSDLERLSKERELVGIYLSAHPLDEFSIALEYGCNTRIAELTDKESLHGREITFGGIVTGIREGVGKNNKPYAFISIEDFSGTGELGLFGEDYTSFRNFGYNGAYLFVRAKVEPRHYDQTIFDLKVLQIQLLPDVKDKLIEKLSISIPYKFISTPFIKTLQDIIGNTNKGTTQLLFEFVDGENDYRVKTRSNHKISISKELTSFLNETEEITFSINQ